MTRSRPLRAAIWRHGRACSSAGSRSTRAAAPASSYSPGRRRHFRLHPPPARPANAAGHQATLSKTRIGGLCRQGAGQKRRLVGREGQGLKGRDQRERLAVPETLRRAEKRIWSGVRGQSRDSGLGRSGLGGGDTNAKKGAGVGADPELRRTDL